MYWHQVAFILLFTSPLTLLDNYLCALDTTLRIRNTWYKLHVINYQSTALPPSNHSWIVISKVTLAMCAYFFDPNVYFWNERCRIQYVYQFHACNWGSSVSNRTECLLDFFNERKHDTLPCTWALWTSLDVTF